MLDEESTTFGIRSLTVDPVRGLRINGETVLLRGACVHHDNGPLGAATIGRAEERRVELLKEAGFNAISSAHNPLSKPMLDACDRLGVLVMDETFDMWAKPKSEHDYALRFPDWWEADVEAMVRKDGNHPSVILYSIGNEIPEAGTPMGARMGRAVAEKIRALDPTRFVTEAISGLLAGGPELFAYLARRTGASAVERARRDDGREHRHDPPGRPPERAHEGSASSPRTRPRPPPISMSSGTTTWTPASTWTASSTRTGSSSAARRIPPPSMPAGPPSAGYPYVIGDFTWTGWDYLGEVGIGRTVYGAPDPAAGRAASWAGIPWRTAWCGDIDITGHRRPQSYYREIVFGLRSDPVRRRAATRAPRPGGERHAVDLE